MDASRRLEKELTGPVAPGLDLDLAGADEVESRPAVTMARAEAPAEANRLRDHPDGPCGQCREGASPRDRRAEPWRGEQAVADHAETNPDEEREQHSQSRAQGYFPTASARPSLGARPTRLRARQAPAAASASDAAP